MRRILRARLFASALAFSAVPFILPAVPAQAQGYADISFDSFHDQLAQYGYWVYSDRWGLVWQPADVGEDFQPYMSNGYWAYTDDYGWYWTSNYPWGDIAFHYGRWVNDPDDGWMWIPGYTWSPGWVVWRTSGQYIGWMPAPPDEAFLSGRGDVSLGVSFGFGGGQVSFNWNDPYYGYRSWYGPDFDDRRFASNWVFIGVGHMADRDYRQVVIRDPVRVVNIIHETRNVTNYTVVNNYVVNKSIDVRVVERAAGHPIQAVPARVVIRHPEMIARVDVSQRIAARERVFTPHGMGTAGSAPRPSPSVVMKLSPQAATRNGQAPRHLFTKTTIAAPEAQGHFHGPAPSGQGLLGPGEKGAEPNGPQPGTIMKRQPGGTNGPENGNAPQTGTEMRHHEQTQPGGMSGPENGNAPQTGTEMRHHEQTQPGGTSGPENGNAPQTGTEMRHHEQTQPGGMSGPENGNAPQTGTEMRRREQTQPGGMSGPENGNAPQTGTEMRHREQTQPGGMSGPENGNAPQTGTEMRHREQTQPGGMSGPGAGPGYGSHQTAPRTEQGTQPSPSGQTKEKKEKKPSEQQPGNPQ